MASCVRQTSVRGRESPLTTKGTSNPHSCDRIVPAGGALALPERPRMRKLLRVSEVFALTNQSLQVLTDARPEEL